MKLGKSMMNRAAPKLEGAIEERLERLCLAQHPVDRCPESRRFLLDRFDEASIREVA